MRSSLNADFIQDMLALNAFGKGMRHWSEHRYCLKDTHDILAFVTVCSFSKKLWIAQLTTPLISSTCAGSKYACVMGLQKVRSVLQLSNEYLQKVSPKEICIFANQALLAVSEASANAS